MRFIFLLISLLLTSTANAATQVAVSSTAWVQVSPTETFFMQSQCGKLLYLKPSPSQPAAVPGDRDDAFVVMNYGDVWVQNIPTSDVWWIRSSAGTCVVVVEEI